MKKKKWRDVKNALVMVVVMAAMMSTATYAWFTLTSNATVTGMQMTAGGSSGLQVSTDGGTNWADTADLNATLEEGADPNQMIHQVTVKDGDPFVPTFYKPIYTDSKVTAVEPIASGLSTYVATYNFKIRSVADSAQVGIKTAKNANDTDGSFVRATDSNDSNSAARAVRIGLVIDNSNEMFIFEPNHEDALNGGKAAVSTYEETYNATVIATDITGEITTARGNEDANTSEALFTAVNGGTDVTMYVWLEGTDDDCVNEIQADQLMGQIQFTIINPPAEP